MRALLVLVALLVGPSGCAELDSSEEVVDLTPSDSKADGDTYARVQLAPGKNAAYVVYCNEFFSCDLTLYVTGTPASTHQGRVRLGAVRIDGVGLEVARKGDVWTQEELQLTTHSSDREAEFQITVTNVSSAPVDFELVAAWR